MPMFDLGTHLDVEREIPVGAETAYRIAGELVERYANEGLDVRLDESQAPERLIARFRHPKGTAIAATVDLTPTGPATIRLKMHLQGKVFVGGMQGMLASDGLVRKIARDKLSEQLDRILTTIEPEEPPPPAPEPEAAAPAEPAPAPAPAPQPEPEAAPPEAAPPEAPQPEPAPPADYAPGSIEAKLALVKTLYERGLIDADDYRRKKQELLDSLVR